MLHLGMRKPGLEKGWQGLQAGLKLLPTCRLPPDTLNSPLACQGLNPQQVPCDASTLSRSWRGDVWAGGHCGGRTVSLLCSD